jgi:hypothetical protein
VAQAVPASPSTARSGPNSAWPVAPDGSSVASTSGTCCSVLWKSYQRAWAQRIGSAFMAQTAAPTSPTASAAATARNTR